VVAARGPVSPRPSKPGGAGLAVFLMTSHGVTLLLLSVLSRLLCMIMVRRAKVVRQDKSRELGECSWRAGC
jgi:hypothetical protein